MASFLLRAGADTERGDNRFAGEVRKEHMLCVGDDRMRDAGLGAFTLSTLELAEVFALNGDFGAADSGCSVGEGLFRRLVQTCPKRVCVRVTGLSTELAGRHLEICPYKGVNVEFLSLGFCLGQCGLNVLVNARCLCL